MGALDNAIQAYATLHNMEQQKEASEIRRQALLDQQEQTRYERSRQEAADLRVQEEADRTKRLNATQALGYTVKGALANDENKVTWDSLPTHAQKVAEEMGLVVNTGLKTNGVEERIIDTSKITPEIAKAMSPLYANADDAQVKAIAAAFSTLKNKLDHYGQAIGPVQAGRVITDKEDPELFAAFNTALGSSVNKGLDDVVAQKRVTAAVVNADDTISLEVESIGKDGKSLGIAPVTYGRANGDPNSVVMKIPISAMYRYIEVNKELGDRLDAAQVALGDDTPLTDQAAFLKSKRTADAITEEMFDDGQGGALAKKRLKMFKSLTTAGVPVENALSTARLIGVEKADRKESWRGVKGRPALEQLYIDGKPVPESEGGIRQRWKPDDPKSGDGKGGKKGKFSSEAEEKLYDAYLKAYAKFNDMKANLGKEITVEDPNNGTVTRTIVNRNNLAAAESAVRAMERTGRKLYGWKSPDDDKGKPIPPSTPAISTTKKQASPVANKPKAADFWKD